MSKICKKCGLDKGSHEFGADRSSSDGLRNVCRLCRSEQRKIEYKKNSSHYKSAAKDWAGKNPDKVRAGKKKQRQKPGFSERQSEYLKQWRLENKEKMAEYFRLFYQKNKETRDAYARQYFKDHPEARRANDQRRMSAGQSDGTVTPAFIRFLELEQRGCCAACKVPFGKKYHADHVTALSKGGKHTASNIQLLCPPCNIRKSAKDPIAFMQSMGYLL